MTTDQPISFPRQEAATRRFRLGLPRAFAVAPDGGHVAFIRSSGGRDPVGSLWVAEADGSGGLTERLIVDARGLVRADADLPAAEKARRERMRETTAGITAFSTDDPVDRAAFSIDGVLYSVGFRPDDATAVELPSPGPVVDPRLSPDGRLVAFVSDRALCIVDATGASPARVLCQPDSDTESWGLADFVAAEELDRFRGLWWLSDSSAVLAELVDEAPVQIRWIADPANPDREPVPHRYPSAGTANPVARLFHVSVDGTRVEIEWDREAFPYLATVQTDDSGGAVVSVLSRDQQAQRIIDVAVDGSSTVARDRHCHPWITMQAGVPARLADGRLLEIVANTTDDCFQLVADDAAQTPPGLNITGVLHADADGILVTAQPGPFDQHLYRVTSDGSVVALTEGPGVHSAAAGSGGVVVAASLPDRTGTTFAARLDRATADIVSLAEAPVVRPQVAFHQVTDRQLPCAVLWPTGHVPGSGVLPVIMAPYGGPHHARVVHAAGAFLSDQWLADQGFAVVVIDGAGTPGRGPAVEFEVRNDFATGVLADQVAGLQALAVMYPDLDLGRVGITGWSFGGYLSALAVLDRPDVFHAAVVGAPVTDWALYDTAYTERYLGLPQDNAAVYEANSVVRRAAQLERPALIIHGLADDNVLVANTLQFSSALLAAGRPHFVLPLTGVTHMTPQEEVAENLLLAQVGFLKGQLTSGL